MCHLREDTIPSRFERQVAAVPDELAIVTDETSMTTSLPIRLKALLQSFESIEEEERAA
jgi:hypothetical protein